jgi:hypothetical protein
MKQEWETGKQQMRREWETGKEQMQQDWKAGQQVWKTGLTPIVLCLALLFVSLAIPRVGDGSGSQQFVAGIFCGMSIACGLLGIYLTAGQIGKGR